MLSLVPVAGVEIFAGIVFLNQHPNHTAFADVVGDLPEKLKRYDLEDLELHGIKNYTIQSNWKLLAENFMDFYHVNAVHPSLSKFSKVEDHQAYQGQGQYVGFVTSPLTNSGSPGDLHHFNLFPRASAMEQQAALFFHIFPNVSVTVYPHSVYTLIMLPSEECGKTHEQLTFLMGANARKEQDSEHHFKQKCDNLMDFIVNVNNEDVQAVENLQNGLRNARNTNVQGEFLPEYDWPIHRFQNMVISGLNGEPLASGACPPPTSEFEKALQVELLTH
jgi:phenylpropionate dioxygenase-like ring-hydroxylating dioxygenase large terminal subunit